MSLADATLYRKTAQAQAELAQRKGSLAPRERMVLVMVNGVDTVAKLVARLGPAAADTLAQLLSLGMIEAVEAAPPPQRPAARSRAAADMSLEALRGAPSVTAGASAAATPAPAHSAEVPAAASPSPATPTAASQSPPPSAAVSDATPRQRASRELVRLLAPRFGPDATRIAQPALEAADAAGFNAALDGIAARLGIHLGRKAAEQLLAPLRLPT